MVPCLVQKQTLLFERTCPPDCGCCLGPVANKVWGRLCSACLARICAANSRSAGVPCRSPDNDSKRVQLHDSNPSQKSTRYRCGRKSKTHVFIVLHMQTACSNTVFHTASLWRTFSILLEGICHTDLPTTQKLAIHSLYGRVTSLQLKGAKRYSRIAKKKGTCAIHDSPQCSHHCAS